MNVSRWFSAAVLAASTASAALVDGPSRLLNVVATAGVVGVALAVMHTQKQLNQAFWMIVAVFAMVGALAALVFHKYKESTCTAVNAYGQRVVIGTEFTPLGLKYKRDNPSDDNNLILEALAGRAVDLAWTPESIGRCRLILALSGGLWIPLLGVSAVASSASIFRSASQKRARTRPLVFVSYSHDDSEVVARLHKLLRDNDIDVTVDTDAMAPGERISDFIERSIRDADVVVSVVSTRSLQSAWVASETIQSISHIKWRRKGGLIACVLDDDWAQAEFRLQCTRQIDERLQRIEKLLPDYAAQRLDSTDLNEEKTRLFGLRNNLGDLLATFKETLCLDIRGERFLESGKRLVEAIRTFQ